MERVHRRIIVYIPGFCFSWNDFSCFIISYQSLKQLMMKGLTKELLVVGVDTVRFVVQNIGQFLCFLPDLWLPASTPRWKLFSDHRWWVSTCSRNCCAHHGQCQKKTQSFFHFLFLLLFSLPAYPALGSLRVYVSGVPAIPDAKNRFIICHTDGRPPYGRPPTSASWGFTWLQIMLCIRDIWCGTGIPWGGLMGLGISPSILLRSFCLASFGLATGIHSSGPLV